MTKPILKKLLKQNSIGEVLSELADLIKIECESNKELTAHDIRLIKYAYIDLLKQTLTKD